MKPLKILCVDDEVEILGLLEIFLEGLGHRVLKASGGHQAVQCLSEDKDIELVITDIRMPEGDGVRILNFLKDTARDVPVLMTSGFTDYEARELLKMGVSGFLEKPFSLMSIESEIMRLFDHP